MMARNKQISGSHSRLGAIYDEQGRPADATYRARFEGLYWASREVGTSDAARLRWLVRVVGLDLKASHPGLADVIGDQLVVFGTWPWLENFHGGVRLAPSLPRTETLAIHEELTTLVRQAVTQQTGTAGPVFETDGVAFSVIRLSAPGVKPAVYSYSLGGDIRSLVLLKARDLLVRVGRDLLGCGYCGGPFLSVRRQKFCTETCAQKERNARKEARGTRSISRGRDGKTTRTR